jgi:peptide/nickel transport system permease protein
VTATTLAAPADEAPPAAPPPPEAQLTPRQLMWLRFKRHRMAMAGAVVVVAIYLVALLAEFLSPMDPTWGRARFTLHPPQPLQLFDASGQLNLHVQAWKLQRDPETLEPRYVRDGDRIIEVGLFLPTEEPWHLFGLIPVQRKLIGTRDPTQPLYLAGADRLGRDVLSRTLHGARISMSIGLLGVTASLLLGVLIGGLSGYLGGRTDWLLQRLTEFVIALPTIPIWMALAAALPKDWPPLLTYFMITVIVSLIGWTDLARVVRGRFLSLRNEDFVTAARIDGCSELRIVLRHMLPSMTSHIIATVSLAIPMMILAETALSFLGLGLQPPAISWGVLLKEVQNVRSIALAPWLFLPGAAVVVAVLALNFLGDGLRDAADPYA